MLSRFTSIYFYRFCFLFVCFVLFFSSGGRGSQIYRKKERQGERSSIHCFNFQVASRNQELFQGFPWWMQCPKALAHSLLVSQTKSRELDGKVGSWDVNLPPIWDPGGCKARSLATRQQNWAQY